jgi:hypothetical protein
MVLIAIGSFGEVGSGELLLARVVALVVAFAVHSRRRRAAV